MRMQSGIRITEMHAAIEIDSVCADGHPELQILRRLDDATVAHPLRPAQRPADAARSRIALNWRGRLRIERHGINCHLDLGRGAVQRAGIYDASEAELGSASRGRPKKGGRCAGRIA